MVVAPYEVALGFALGGAEICIAETPGAAVAGVEAALLGNIAVVAVHHSLWQQLPAQLRTRWEQSTTQLVISLPADDGASTLDRAAVLHELLARAVGYEITFTTSGAS